MKEATARIKINKLLEAAGWRFFAGEAGRANIRLEPSVTLKESDLDARAVLDHYRPHIPIHPDWPMVELGEICEIKSGGTPSRSDDTY